MVVVVVVSGSNGGGGEWWWCGCRTGQRSRARARQGTPGPSGRVAMLHV